MTAASAPARPERAGVTVRGGVPSVMALRRPELVALAGYCAIALAVGWNLLGHFGTAVWGTSGDTTEFLWKLWWVPHALGAHLNVNFAPQVFPESGGYDLGSAAMSPTATWLFMPVTIAFGAITTYNVVMLLSFVIGGMGTFLLARRLGAGAAGAFLAGAVYVLGPFHMLEIGYHLHEGQLGYLPWVFWAMDRQMESARWRDAALTGVFFAMASMTDWYELAYLLFSLPFFILLRPGGRAPWRRLLGSAAVAAAVAAVVMGPFVIPVVHYSLAHHPPADMGEWLSYSDPLGFYLTLHTVLAAAVIAAFASLARGYRRAAACLLVVASVGFVLSLGPVLRLDFTNPVTLDMKAPAALHALAQSLTGRTDPRLTVIPLPDYLLMRLPGAKGLRSMSRAEILVDFGVAVAAGLGLTVMLRRRHRLRPVGIVAAVLLAAVVGVGAAVAAPPIVTPAPRPVDFWLAQRPSARLIQLPFDDGHTGYQLYWSEFNHMEPELAQATTLPPPLPDAVGVFLRAFPSDPAWVAVLRQWKTKYLLVETAHVADINSFRARVSGWGLTRLATLGGIDVYDVGS